MEYTDATVPNGTWKECVHRDGEWVASGLEPLTHYRFRLWLQYVRGADPYYWTGDDQFTYETLGECYETLVTQSLET